MFCAPLASAFTTQAGESLQPSDVIDDDYYVAAADLQSSAAINGDLFAAGSNVYINGAIAEDANAAGARVIINSRIGDDLRIAGSVLEINENVDGDVLAFGAEVRIKEGVTIGGDLIVAGWVVYMGATVKGDAIINGGQIYMNGSVAGNTNIGVDGKVTVNESASIWGTLDYSARSEIPELENVTAGEVNFTKAMIPQTQQAQSVIIGMGIKYLVLKFIGLVLIGSLLVFGLPALFATSANMLMTKPWQSIVYGLALLIGIPIAVLLLCTTVVGIPLGLFLLMLYIFLFVFAELLGIAVFTPFIMSLFKKKKVWQRWEKLLVLTGITLLFIIINGIDMLAIFFAWGAIILAFRNKGVDVLKCQKKK